MGNYHEHYYYPVKFKITVSFFYSYWRIHFYSLLLVAHLGFLVLILGVKSDK